MPIQIDREKVAQLSTPFYYYDTTLLRDNLEAIRKEIGGDKRIFMHYAVKANANLKLLQIIREAGFGVDCVSGGEIERSIQAGFSPDKIVFAGVGKSDWEIELGIDKGIFCFNVESLPELEVINEIAARKGRRASVCFRVNPDVAAHTHAHITTGKAENKFGIAMDDLEPLIHTAGQMENIDFKGIHFHIGSQITNMGDFNALALRVNELQDRLEKAGVRMDIINVGGGLGIDYDNPEENPIPNFKDYFATYRQMLQLRPGQTLHFELGRAVTGQCGCLITKVLYVKTASTKKFAIVDAGFTDLIRPALYGAHHKIVNLSRPAQEQNEPFDVVGPICESSDVFGKDVPLPAGTQRGDLIAILSAGAYGEIMASSYNCRKLPQAHFSQE